MDASAEISGGRSCPGPGAQPGSRPRNERRGFNRNDHRNWFDPGNDCQKAANMTSCDDDADPSQRRGSGDRHCRHPPSRKYPPPGADARLHAPVTPVAVSAGAARRSPAPSWLGKAARLGWTPKAAGAGAPACILAAGALPVAIRSRHRLSRPPFSTRAGHRGARFALRSGRQAPSAVSRGARATAVSEPPRGNTSMRICRSMLHTAAGMVTLAQIWVARFRQRRYR